MTVSDWSPDVLARLEAKRLADLERVRKVRALLEEHGPAATGARFKGRTIRTLVPLDRLPRRRRLRVIEPRAASGGGEWIGQVLARFALRSARIDHGIPSAPWDRSYDCRWLCAVALAACPTNRTPLPILLGSHPRWDRIRACPSARFFSTLLRSLVLASAACALAAPTPSLGQGTVLYDIKFNAPKHTLNATPALGDIDGISRVKFGAPRVVSGSAR